MVKFIYVNFELDFKDDQVMENIQGSVSSWNTIINKVEKKTVRVVLDEDNRIKEESFLFPKAVALFDLILEKLGLESFTFTAESVTKYLTALEYSSQVIKFTEEEHKVVINSLIQCRKLNLPDAVKCRIDLVSDKLKLMYYIATWVKGPYEATLQQAGIELNDTIKKDNSRDPLVATIEVKVDDYETKDAAIFLGISQDNSSKNCQDMTMEQFAYSVAATQGTGNSYSGFKMGYIKAGIGVCGAYDPSYGGVSCTRLYVINNDKNSDNLSVTQTTSFEAKPAESISSEKSVKSVKWSVESELVFSKTKLNAMLELYKNGKDGEITLAQVNQLITSRELTKVEGLTLQALAEIKQICANYEKIQLNH